MRSISLVDLLPLVSRSLSLIFWFISGLSYLQRSPHLQFFPRISVSEREICTSASQPITFSLTPRVEGSHKIFKWQHRPLVSFSQDIQRWKLSAFGIIEILKIEAYKNRKERKKNGSNEIKFIENCLLPWVNFMLLLYISRLNIVSVLIHRVVFFSRFLFWGVATSKDCPSLITVSSLSPYRSFEAFVLDVN